MNPEEKRKYFRINSLNLSYVFINGSDEIDKQSMGRTLNISEAGILLEMHFPVKPQDNLLLSLGLEEDVIDIKGKVVHSKATGSGTYELGIQFIDPDEKAKGALRQFVEQFKARGGKS